MEKVCCRRKKVKLFSSSWISNTFFFLDFHWAKLFFCLLKFWNCESIFLKTFEMKTTETVSNYSGKLLHRYGESLKQYQIRLLNLLNKTRMVSNFNCFIKAFSRIFFFLIIFTSTRLIIDTKVANHHSKIH